MSTDTASRPGAPRDPVPHAAPDAPRSTDALVVGGVFEVVVGTDDLVGQIRWWTQFGYRIGETGEGAADAAERLYGVRSGLRSVRMRHLDADHGLVRLVEWEAPTGPGLGTAPLRAQGSRWTAMLSADVTRVANHARVAEEGGADQRFVPPQWAQIYEPPAGNSPFFAPLVGVREMMLLRPQARQVLFQRFGYTVPLYGQVNEGAFFPTSQVTHVGLLHHGDHPEWLAFYDALGLVRARHAPEFTPAGPGARAVWDLQEGDGDATTDFDDPRSVPGDMATYRSGRLKIVRFPDTLDTPDLRERSGLGQLGYSAYVYRVRDLDAAHRVVAEAGATDVTDPAPNEFGERSLSFTAPDGYAWVLVDA